MTILIFQKTLKIDKFVKGTPYTFLSKNTQNWQISKGYPLWFFIKKHSKLTILKNIPILKMFLYEIEEEF